MKGTKIKLYPTESQKNRLLELIDLYRFVYNWAIHIQIDNRNSGNKYIRFYDLCKIFESFRKEEKNKWLLNIPLNTARHALMDADQAFMNFFNKRSRFPRFKSKKNPNHSFTTRSDRLYFKDDHVRLEGFKRGEMILTKSTRLSNFEDVAFYNSTISTDGIDFYLSVNIIDKIPMEFDNQNEPIGIDLGLKHLAVLSDGTVYDHPNLRRLNRRIKKQQRQVAKDLNRRKALAKEAKTKPEEIQWTNGMIKRSQSLKKSFIRKKNIIQTNMHQITREIVNKFPSSIVLETLNIREMMHKKYLSRFVIDSTLYKFIEYLSYKCQDNSINIIKADPWYPSSQICSNCGFRQKIGNKRIYKCHCCGLEIDRDLNAAINLKKLATV